MKQRLGKGTREVFSLAAPLPPWCMSKAASVIAVLTLRFQLFDSSRRFAETNTLRMRLSPFACCLATCYFLQPRVQIVWKERINTNKNGCGPDRDAKSWLVARKGVESSGRYWEVGGDRMCAISDTVLSGQLCPHCSITAGNDFTVTSCHMMMTLLTPLVMQQVTLVWIGWMTSLRCLLLWESVNFLSFFKVPQGFQGTSEELYTYSLNCTECTTEI